MDLRLLGLKRFTEGVLFGTAYGLSKIEQGKAIGRFGLPEKPIVLKKKT